MDSLKNCPFCGSDDVELRAGVFFAKVVHCNNCAADVVFNAVRIINDSYYDFETVAVKGWNNRADNSAEKGSDKNV